MTDGVTDGEESTDVLGLERQAPAPRKLVVAAGPDRGRAIELTNGTYLVGKSHDCALVLTDPAVSRRHLEVALVDGGVRVSDLGSTNGSFCGGARFESIVAPAGAIISLGGTALLVAAPEVPPPEGFGALLGTSAAIRQVFTVLERVAQTDAAVLVQGETGTGKELVAEALHAASARRRGPFVICDLASVQRSLIESELFGHVRGAFTGADRDRPGAFAQADGGTLFLDEIGELEVDCQPRLLRALERGQVKPVGGAAYKTCDVRVVAATNRDLLAEARAGRFREDLYHRLAVVCVVLPPLRERREDVEPLVTTILAQSARPLNRPPPVVPPETMRALRAHDWPGNVRELKNVLERAMSLAPDAEILDATLLGLSDAASASRLPVSAVDVDLPFKEAKDRLVVAWEREYLRALLAASSGNVSAAARRAGIDRGYLHRLLRKHRWDIS